MSEQTGDPEAERPGTLDTRDLARREVGGELVDGVGDAVALPPRIGAYRIVRELGRGGMGVVHLAEEDGTGRKVALKIMARALASRRSLERFAREVRLVANLEHAAIIRVLATGDIEGVPYYAMEYVEGTTVADHVVAGGADPRWVATLGLTVARGLAHAHKRGVIHRDIKPRNLLLSAVGPASVRIADFGLARHLEEPRATISGAVVGTPLYMAPEQVGGGRVDTRSDLYSLGVTLYELLTGVAPFDGPTFEALRAAIEAGSPRPPRRLAPRIPADLERIVLSLVAREPDRRYQTADALAADLEAWLDGRPVSATRPTVGYHLRRFVARNRALTATVVLFSAAGLAFGTWSIVQLDERRRAAERAEGQVRAREAEVRRLLAESTRRRAEGLVRLGELEFERGAYDRARACLQESLGLGGPARAGVRWRLWACQRRLPAGSMLVAPPVARFTALALAPGGRTFVGGGSGGWACLGDTLTGRLAPAPATGDSAFVRFLRYLPDGRLVRLRGRLPACPIDLLATPADPAPVQLGHGKWVSIDAAGRLAAWPADGRLVMRRLSGAAEPVVTPVTVSGTEWVSISAPDRPVAVTDIVRREVVRRARLVDPRSGRLLRSMTLHPGTVALMSPDGRRVAYTRPGSVFVVEDVEPVGGETPRETGRLRRVEIARRAVLGGRWLADGRLLAVEGDRGSPRVTLWDLERRARLAVLVPALRAGARPTYDVCADASRFGAIVLDGRLLVRPTDTPGERVVSETPQTGRRELLFGLGGRAVARRSQAGRLEVWPTEPGESRLRGALSDVQEVVGTAAGFVVRTTAGVARWRPGQPAPTRTIAVPANAAVGLLADGGALIRTAAGQYWRHPAVGPPRRLCRLAGRRGAIVRVSARGRYAVEVGDREQLELLDLEAGGIRRLQLSSREVSRAMVVFTRDERHLLVVSAHRRLRTIALSGVGPGIDIPIGGSPRQLIDGGATILLAGRDALRVIDRADGRLVFRGRLPAGAAAVSADGRWLARVGHDHHVHLHDLTCAGPSPLTAR